MKTGRGDRAPSGSPRTGELVALAQGGDKEAFATLYETYYGPVFRLARFYLSADGAEDATSETFVRAWQALPRYRDTGAPFASWLYGIARHVVADVRRASRRSEPRDELPDDVLEMGMDLADRIVLQEAVAKLPRGERRVVEMKYLVGLTNDEIAATLGKSTGAVNATRWRAMRRLRDLLGEP